jgi:Tfp pilus assembly PilM family ATPase
MSGMKFLSSSTFPLKSNDETIAEMKSFIAENVRGPHEVFVAVPHKWSIIKFIEVPSPKAKGKDALAHMMKFEIERHVPYPVEDIFFDFQVISKSGSIYNVMAAAVHKDRISYIQEFLEKFPLEPGVITLSSFAILNSIECGKASISGWQAHMGFSKKSVILGGRGETCITLFLSNNNIYCALMSDGACQYVTAFDIDRNMSTAEIAEDLSSRVSDILSEFSLEKTDRLLVAGMIGPFSDLPGILGENFGTSVQTYHPLAELIPGQEDPQSLHLAPSIGACYLGLDAGAIRINLLPHKTGALFRKTGALVSKIAAPLIILMFIGI